MNNVMTKESNRLLAAIMFTDMVGYTALMQENERLAKQNRDRHRKVQQEAAARHRGKILQYYGDGTLIIFNSAIEAVGCAVDIQTQLQKDPPIPLRIGIHTGDIVYDDEGIYGDGVNIASRIEGLSTSGSVLISDKLADDLKNQPGFGFKSLGKFQLKNVKRPVEVYAVTNKGLSVPDAREIETRREEHVKSIAVLPFVNMSSDPENEYFSDGITEELLNALSKIDGLQVTARTSSFAFKGQSLDIREIGRQLGVKTVLEGSVRKAGGKVRITAQLISIADGYHIWSEAYDRQLEDIFDIQDEISQKITNKLREKLYKEAENENLVIPSTNNLDAYNLYLKSLFYQNKWTLNDNRTAIDLLKQALELDPDFALAMAELSKVYINSGVCGRMPLETAYSLSKEYALKANELDKNLPESHLALAYNSFWLERNREQANKHVNEAIKLNPSFAGAYQVKGMLFMASHQLKEAAAAAKLSLQLDPLSAPSSIMIAFIYFGMNEIEKAFRQVEKTQKIDPNFTEALNLKGWLYLEKQEYKKAIAIFEEAGKVPGNEPDALSGLGMIYGRMGDMESAGKYLNRLLDLQKKMQGISIFYKIGLVYSEMGDTDNMFLYFNKSFEAGEGEVNFMNSLIFLKKYHSDPRYIELNRKMGGSSDTK